MSSHVDSQKIKLLLSYTNAEERWDESQTSRKAVFHFGLTPIKKLKFLIRMQSDRADVENEHEVF